MSLRRTNLRVGRALQIHGDDVGNAECRLLIHGRTTAGAEHENCNAPMGPGPRGDRDGSTDTRRNDFDDGPHQQHAPRSGSDPIMVAVYVFVAVCMAIAGGIVVWGWS